MSIHDSLAHLRTFLRELLFLNHSNPDAGAGLQFVIHTPEFEIRTNDMQINLNDNQSIALKLAGKSAKGNSAALPGDASTVQNVVSSDPAIITVTRDPDGVTYHVAAVGPVGTATLTASYGALTASAQVVVQAGPAVTIDFEAGAVSAQ